MEAIELRIGNWIYINGKPIQINAGFIHDLDYSNKYPERQDSFVFDDIKPIQLTEEWLLDFGFEKKSWKTKNIVIECFYYQLYDFIVYLVSDFFEVELINKSGDQFNLFKKWKNVHQLQNLYFYLTGTEITSKLI